MGIHKGLKPMLIKEYSDKFELLIVEVTAGDKEIRVISGYGPQENWPEDNRMPFFVALEEESVKPEMMDKSFIIEMDANSKLGPGIIPNDPHSQSQNGKILIERHGLVVGNSLENKCHGVITRKRVTIDGIEESVIDFIITSRDIVESIQSILIDEEREHVLTKLMKVKGGTKKKESDHNPIITKLNFTWRKTIQN